jgi:hypothetical protein
MKAINIEGISFTEKGIQLMKDWLTPTTDLDNPLIKHNIAAIEQVQSFLINNWDDVKENKMKPLLTGLQSVKENLVEFQESINTLPKGDKA